MARILIIDDENNIRMMVRLALEHVGHTIGTAPDGPEGLERFGTGEEWDLVLLDQRMPGMEGLDVLREMRRRNPGARIVMITAFGTVDLAVDAMKAGARDFLRKPFTAETLRGAVQSVMESAPTRDRPLAPSEVGTTFSLSTFNGYWIESRPGPGVKTGGDLQHTFTITSPDGEKRTCEVILPGYIVELVKAHADCETFPGGDRFFQALCEEVAANYVWQHSEFPPDGVIRVDELTNGLKRWIDAVLAGTRRDPGAG